MIAQYECIHHENKQISRVCLESHCRDKLSCEECLAQNQEHTLHEKTKFSQFLRIWEVVENSKAKTRHLFRKIFDGISSKLQQYLKSVEEKVLAEFYCKIDDVEHMNISSLEIQQIYGLVDECLKNKFLTDMLFREMPEKMFLGSVQHEEKYLTNLLGQLQDRILQEMNSVVSQMKKSNLQKQKKKQMMLEVPMKKQLNFKKQTFKFSKIDKSHYLQVSKDQMSIFRPKSEQNQKKNYLTVYGLTSEPLTAFNNQITFLIQQQKIRFMYLGVCFPEPFRKHKFEGPVYQMGNGMFGIRQNESEGKTAVSLHNSLKIFSNKLNVGWDFKQGDKIKLVLELEKKNLLFLWNEALFFNLPLDSDKQQFFPFVGIKGHGGLISIIQEDLAPIV